jgi:2-dehydro-3-deoxyglucarate aldolase
MSNPMLQKLRAREPLWGCWLSLAAPLAAEALSHAGFDFLVIDTEHAPHDTMDVVALLQAIGNGAAAPCVRVTENQPALAKRVLDAGAHNLIFPNVGSAAEAEHAVASCRYPQPGQGGRRGVAGGVRAARFGFDRDYLQQANAHTGVIVQVESAAGLASAEAIAAVDGVDALFVGPADLAASLGHLGNPQHAEVQAAIAQVAAAAARRQKACGIFCSNVQAARLHRAQGFTFLALAADLTWLLQGATGALQAARD